MAKLFNIDGPLYKWMNKYTDIAICNFCFVIGALPIFTIGTSLTAMYSVLFKMQSRSNPSVWKEFWKAYKENFRQSTVIWLGCMIVGSWLIFCIYLFSGSNSRLFQTYFIVMLILFSVLLIFILYVFPVISRFENSIKNLVVNSFVICFANLKITIVMILLIITILLLVFYNVFTLGVSIIIAITFGIALVSYWLSFYLDSVFEMYITKAIEKDNN